MESWFMDKMTAILASPTSIAALAALMIFIFALLRVKKITLTTRMITHIGLALALAAVLHAVRIYHLPQGGSITLGSMIPILLIALYYGAEVGYLTGFLYGMINLIQDPFILHPVQVLFDYPLPFMALGLTGYFKERMMLGTTIAVFGRFICHFLSGVVFFASYAPPGMSPYLYSLVFNGSYLVLELVICLLIMRVLPVKRLEMTIHHQ